MGKRAVDPRDTIFEPNVQAIVNKLSQMFFSQSIFRDVLEAKAAEHSERMFAMKNATDNTDSLSKNPAMEYNEAQQAIQTLEKYDALEYTVVVVAALLDHPSN